MLERLRIVIASEDVARCVGFFSFGTNELTQTGIE
ncbi:MAG TPA: hypothetical protein DIV39_00045 [Verrucomicrobiales bacterium]|nr:hypothetical protein [Verrucomicrobiales bacterium]